MNWLHCKLLHLRAIPLCSIRAGGEIAASLGSSQ